MSAPTATEDPRWKQGRIFMNEKKYEDAIEIYSSLLQTQCEQYGDLAPECAKAYYSYGNALLTKEEETPTDTLLGNVDGGENNGNDSSKAAPPPDIEVSDEDEDGGGQDGGDYGEPEDADDLQVAFEVLESARVILTMEPTHLDKDSALLLAKVHMRLGDLERINNNLGQAITEYTSALNLRLNHLESHDSEISHTYFYLAVAHVYNVAEIQEETEKVEQRKKALGNYELARETILCWLKKHEEAETDSVGLKAEIADKKELIDELQETIDALRLEIAEEIKNSKSGPVTTIGFGTSSASSSSSSSSSSAAAAAPVTTIGFGATSSSPSMSAIKLPPASDFSASVNVFSTDMSSGAPPVTSAPVNTLLVKRKKREDEN